VCGDGTSVHATGGRERGPGYVCNERSHLRRNAAHLDEHIGKVVVIKLSETNVADLLRPPARTGADVEALRAEARKLRERKAKLGALYAADAIDDDALASGTKVIRDKLASIDSQLAVSDAPDPLAEFRDNPAGVVWDSLSIARRRTIVKKLFESITIMPSGRRGAGFDPSTIVIRWRTA
jgi:site-specific DNA recombinase